MPPLKIRSQPRSTAADIRTTCQRYSVQAPWERAVRATGIDRKPTEAGTALEALKAKIKP